MLEWLALLVGGTLASTHCVGMCGPIVVMIGANSVDRRDSVQRQLAHGLGRCFTYLWMGAIAGLAGYALAAKSEALLKTQAVLSCLAGIVLTLTAVRQLGWLPKLAPIFDAKRKRECASTAKLASWTRGLATTCSSALQARNTSEAFLAGIATGLIPCGLVYGYLAVAVASGNVLGGVAVMAALGLATMPALLVLGIGARSIALRFHRQVHIFAICSLLLAGQWTFARGLHAARRADSDSVNCPVQHVEHSSPGNYRDWKGVR